MSYNKERFINLSSPLREHHRMNSDTMINGRLRSVSIALVRCGFGESLIYLIETARVLLRLATHLNSRLGQSETLTQFLSHECVGIMRLLEQSLELVELLQREICPRSSLLIAAASHHRWVWRLQQKETRIVALCIVIFRFVFSALRWIILVWNRERKFVASLISIKLIIKSHLKLIKDSAIMSSVMIIANMRRRKIDKSDSDWWCSGLRWIDYWFCSKLCVSISSDTERKQSDSDSIKISSPINFDLKPQHPLTLSSLPSLILSSIWHNNWKFVASGCLRVHRKIYSLVTQNYYLLRFHKF